MSSATGKGHGGKRPGAGRKKGTRNALELGAVKGLKALARGVPPNATEAEKQLLGLGEDAIRRVLMGKANPFSANVELRAAGMAFDRIVGPVKQKVEHSGADGGPLQVVVQKLAEPTEATAPAPLTVEVDGE